MLVVTALFAHAACLRPSSADDLAAAEQAESAQPKRWLLLCCGLPGDDEHRERLTLACEQIIAVSGPVLGVSPDALRVLVGDASMQEKLEDSAENIAISTSDAVAEALQVLSEQAGPEDECWVLLLGHSHLYGGSSQFNVQGKDFNQLQFAAWAQELKSKTQVFLLTMPVSGYWIKPLSRDGRVVISATEADLEFTGTEMPYALADVLAREEGSQPLEDVDGDEVVSLLDLYLAVSLEIDARFRSMERLQTEHAQLEDNGDGRGSELQQPYLTVEDAADPPVEDPVPPAENAEPPSEAVEASAETSGPVAKAPRPPLIESESRDGYRSRQIVVKEIQ